MSERDAFEARLRRVGAERYHDRHPFNQRMHAGTLTPAEIRLWVRSRYYYQTRIPLKDAVILTKSDESGFRREWVGRLHDHDGRAAGEGGLELWLLLADAVGLDRARVEDLSGVLQGVRAACDDYVKLVLESDLLVAVASSLTEMFAGDIMRTRIDAFERHYPWVRTEGLRYFQSRTVQAPRDAAFGLRFVLEHAKTREDEDRCVAALERKCEILWRLLDAVQSASRPLRVSPHALHRTDPESGSPLVLLAERAVRMNESGREILDLCDGKRSAASIADTLHDRHPGVADLERDVHVFLDEMERLGVVVPAA